MKISFLLVLHSAASLSPTESGYIGRMAAGLFADFHTNIPHPETIRDLGEEGLAAVDKFLSLPEYVQTPELERATRAALPWLDEKKHDRIVARLLSVLQWAHAIQFVTLDRAQSDRVGVAAPIEGLGAVHGRFSRFRFQ